MIIEHGKSQSQDALAKLLEETFPYARIQQETHINKLIEAQGYTVDEIKEELGYKPHRLFVDIILLDSEGICAYEYQGEQHYHLVGNMTKNAADLALNQKMDEEKSWILARIGIPLVVIPYDTYLDEKVIYNMTENARLESSEDQSKYYLCDSCGRRFPSYAMSGGRCKRCREKEMEEKADTRHSKRTRIIPSDYKSSDDVISEEENDEFENMDVEERKEYIKAKQREMRKRAHEEWKASEEYQNMKEQRKQARKEQYEKIKQERKMARKAERDKKKMEKRDNPFS